MTRSVLLFAQVSCDELEDLLLQAGYSVCRVERLDLLRGTEEEHEIAIAATPVAPEFLAELTTLVEQSHEAGRIFVVATDAPISQQLALFDAGATEVFSLGQPWELLLARLRVHDRWRARTSVRVPKPEKIPTAGGRSDRVPGRSAFHSHDYLATRLGEEFARAKRYNETLSLVAVDVDANDPVDDEIWERCAAEISSQCRPADVVTRGKEEEFVIVLPNTHFSGALATAEKVWRKMELLTPTLGGKASLGVACYPGLEIKSADDLLTLAQAAVKRARQEGTSRICLYQHQGYLFQPTE